MLSRVPSFGATGGQVNISADSGDTWETITRDLPAVLSVEVQNLPLRGWRGPTMTRVVLPFAERSGSYLGVNGLWEGFASLTVNA